MFDEEIILYGKENNHKLAISMLVNKGKFPEAERYCLEKKENLLTILFEKYVECYQNAKEKIENMGDSNTKFKQDIIRIMSKFR